MGRGQNGQILALVQKHVAQEYSYAPGGAQTPHHNMGATTAVETTVRKDLAEELHAQVCMF